MGIHDRDYYQENEVRPLRPWDNKSMVTMLIIVNVAVFLANFLLSAGNGALARSLALQTETLWNPLHWWQFVTYGFTHDPQHIGHILFNMATLYFLGRSVEDRLGKWEFFRFYMIAIVLCGVVWCGLHQSNPGSVIGASGATTAVAMLFVFLFPQATLMLYMAFPVKAWVVGVLIIVGNLFQPMGSAGVAYDVHLVGAAFATAYFFSKWNFGFMGAALSQWTSNARRKRSRLKVHDPAEGNRVERPNKDDAESDRILDKIYREGEDSLSAKERKFMEQYSRRVRQRRGD